MRTGLSVTLYYIACLKLPFLRVLPVSLGVKQVGLEADRPPASSAEIIKYECSCTCFVPHGVVLNYAQRQVLSE